MSPRVTGANPPTPPAAPRANKTSLLSTFPSLVALDKGPGTKPRGPPGAKPVALGLMNNHEKPPVLPRAAALPRFPCRNSPGRVAAVPNPAPRAPPRGHAGSRAQLSGKVGKTHQMAPKQAEPCPGGSCGRYPGPGSLPLPRPGLNSTTAPKAEPNPHEAARAPGDVGMLSCSPRAPGDMVTLPRAPQGTR